MSDKGTFIDLVDIANNRLEQIHERDARIAELVVKVDSLTEKADRGCHSGCLYHEEHGWSHMPNCAHEALRAAREEIARLKRRRDG
jgi:hypothetical protein